MSETLAPVTIEGPLADWVARLETLAEALCHDPRVNVVFYKAAGIEESVLARLESTWKVGSFAPAIRNLYRQANGLCFLWMSTHHPYYPLVREHWTKAGMPQGFSTSPREFRHMPSTHQVDDFPSFIWEGPDAPPHGSPPYGAIYLPPLEKVMVRKAGFIKTSYGGYEGTERNICGRTWKGNSFEEGLRVFDYPQDYCPAAFVMEDGQADPPVVLAEDHSSWDGGRQVSFEAYLEHVLATLGMIGPRRAFFVPGAEAIAPLLFDEVLPPSIELRAADDGATFEVNVQAVQTASASDGRIKLLTELIPGHRVKTAAGVLGLKPLNRKNEILIPEIEAATADPAAIDAKTAGKLMAAALQTSRSKKDYLEAFGVGMAGGETLTLHVSTLYDRSSLDAADVDWDFESREATLQWLCDLGANSDAVTKNWLSTMIVSRTGRNVREAVTQISLSAATGLAVGASARSRFVPSSFTVHKGKIIRRIR
jgi:hypothetical protein